jgi:hypothetical protein
VQLPPRDPATREDEPQPAAAPVDRPGVPELLPTPAPAGA